MNAILLSAGFGTRFKPYTNITAKPTIPFLNLPLIAYSMYYANKWSCQSLAINTHHLPNTITQCVNSLKSNISGDIDFINESPNILDSGGGIKNAENYLSSNNNFLVFNSDIPHVLPAIDFTEIEKQHTKNNSLVTVLTCDLENLGTKIKGLWTKSDSNVVEDIGLGPKDGLVCRHYIGIMLVSKKLFDLQPQNTPHNIIYDVILPAIKSGHKVNTFHIDPLNWFETGNLDSYLDASFEVLNCLINEPNSPFSNELYNIFKKFNLNNEIINHADYKLLYKSPPISNLNSIQMSGHIVLGDNIDLTKLKFLSNSVIYSNGILNTDSCSRQLFL